MVKLGGLYVIGTERHESRRIDNQLRGRAGRQGDPGETRFFVSLEDDLMRIFGGEQISRLMTFFNFPEDQPLSHSMVSKAIEQAQIKVEGFNFDIRRHLVDFDDVLNKQREIIYSLRRDILTALDKDPKKFKETIFKIFKEEIDLLVNNYFSLNDSYNQQEVEKLIKEINFIMSVNPKEIESRIKNNQAVSLIDFLEKKVADEYQAREKKFGAQIWNNIARMIFLTTIDKYWTEHLTSIEDLREGINLRGYAQLDPLVEYKNEAYSMFEHLIGTINFEATRRLFKIKIEEKPLVEETKDQPMIFKSASAIDPFSQQNSQEPQLSTGHQSPVTSHHKIGRNDPCWCGSGKKYKKCHYPN